MNGVSLKNIYMDGEIENHEDTPHHNSLGKYKTNSNEIPLYMH